MRSWFVYILRCQDGSLYTGVTTELERRVNEHNSEDSVTRYTRVRQPVTLVYQESAGNRSEACRREHAIKQLTRRQKDQLIQSDTA